MEEERIHKNLTSLLIRPELQKIVTKYIPVLFLFSLTQIQSSMNGVPIEKAASEKEENSSRETKAEMERTEHMTDLKK